MRRFLRGVVYTVLGLAGLGAVAGVAAVLYAVLVLAPQLPDAESLRDVRFQEPLRVVSAEGELIAEYGEQRRQPVELDEIPTELVLAFLAAEDDRFYQHPGVDYQGLTRAVLHVVREGEYGPGGSTITMQVARNFFLSRDQTILRKVNEILLALQIERTLSKEEILQLYLNKIFLGNRAYGVAAAADVYYGKDLDELDLAQYAMIAGLPRAPSLFNPVRNPERALERRSYVLRRMAEEGYITRERYREAMAAPVTAEHHGPRRQVEARYVGEMARRMVVARHGAEEAYTGGYTVHTTIERDRQHAANEALRRGLRAYDERHGYRGPEGSVAEGEVGDPEAMDAALAAHPPRGGLHAGVVISVEPEAAWAWLRGGRVVEVPFETMEWARPQLEIGERGPAPETAEDVLARGDIVRLEPRGPGFGALGAVPDVQGALAALDPADGRVRALAGGFDFRQSSFNRAVQARRQTGSAFKPFIYSAALENGYTPATLVNDAPVVFEAEGLESHWRPGNYTGRFYGPTRLREALVFSRNLVSIRVLRDVGIERTIRHAERLGFDPATMPDDLSLALGSNSATPLEMATGFAAFANGGFRVVPNVVERIIDADGETVYRSTFPRACETCGGEDDDEAVSPVTTGALGTSVGVLDMPPVAERAIPADNAWLMNDMLSDVVQRGTARRAGRGLDRDDLAGKTGTTNDLRDAWFVGHNRDLAAAAWIGHDDQRSLGRGETGAAAALPIWMRFMERALEGVEQREPSRPEGLVTIRIDPETGRATGSEDPDAIFETFRAETVPARERSSRERDGRDGDRELF